MPTPRFFALLPVRDEADIIEQCLGHALKWADGIFVYDTGSIDETYDLVLEMAKLDDRVFPIGSAPVYYNENRVRGLLFASARERFSNGDWFVRLDADEFHHISPPDFVREKVKPEEGVVYHQYYDFQLLESEAQLLKTEPQINAERLKPIADRRNSFTLSRYAEPRLCRYRSTMRWPVDVSFPYNAGLVARSRIPIRHYPHRDPRQLDRRCKLRAIMMSDVQNRSAWSDPSAHHWTIGNWADFIVPDGREDLFTWKPGEPLHEVQQYNHLPGFGKRFLQKILYRWGIPEIRDEFRSESNDDAHPLPISDAVQHVLEKELAV